MNVTPPASRPLQATPNELSMHVYGAVCDDLQPAGTGCSSEMYTAFLTHRLLERTWWLIAKHQQVTWLDMDRNVADASGAQAAGECVWLA